MNENQNNAQDFNRRDFLKSGSVATIMAMMGGVEIFAQTNAATAEGIKFTGPKVKVGVIGLGAWGREVLNTLALVPEAEVAAVCDTYPAFLSRGGKLAPGAAQAADYKAILDSKDIKAVIVSTPTHKHKDIVLAALQAGKHVYCEAPLANTVEDARAIAAAAKAAKQLVFQAGLQMRSDAQRHFLLPFIRSGALGKTVMARAQWHKKQSWRAASPNPEREKELNWRLSQATSLGLVGEIGIHQIDQAALFLNAQPVAVTGWGSVINWNDGRDVADTVQAVLEFPGKVNMTYDATLGNSFDADYEMLYGGDAAVMMRDGKAWMFKEVDSALLGWEVYARKDTFYKETGIALVADASKPVKTGTPAPESPFQSTPLFRALQIFLRNGGDVLTAEKGAIEALGAEDKTGIAEQIAAVQRRPAAGFLEGYQSAVTVIKANEAVVTRQRIELKPEWYELT